MLCYRWNILKIIHRYKGHAHWQNIKNVKESNDLARSKIFSQLRTRLIQSINNGQSTDMKVNKQLASVVNECKRMNMPAATITRILEKMKAGNKNYFMECILYGDLGLLLTCSGVNSKITKGNIMAILRKIKDKNASPKMTMNNVQRWFHDEYSVVIKLEEFCKEENLNLKNEEEIINVATDRAIDMEADDVTIEGKDEKFLTFICHVHKLSQIEETLRNKSFDIINSGLRRKVVKEATLIYEDDLDNRLRVVESIIEKLEDLSDVIEMKLISLLFHSSKECHRLTTPTILSQILEKKNKKIYNIPDRVLKLTDKKLLHQKYHPLWHLRRRIENYFKQNRKEFKLISLNNPIVSCEENFDSLLVPKSHGSRSPSEQFYLNENEVLRSHTSAHQVQTLKKFNSFCLFGDVYRRDHVDGTHFPIFHQLEAVHVIDQNETINEKMLEEDMKNLLLNLVKYLFENGKSNKVSKKNRIEGKWVDAYFPFTDPSWELEVMFSDESKKDWIELLGCGIMRKGIIEQSLPHQNKIGWAFGIGLERLAMFLYNIPDIRLFWTTDEGFLSQFYFDDSEEDVQYKPISIYPPCPNDISFWINDEKLFDEKDFYDIVLSIGNENIERIQLMDKFTHSKTGKRSLCYRIVYRNMERSLTQKEVNEMHYRIEKKLVDKFSIDIR
ncbi:hypothetical protein SNEBB_001644 [Seison nebaliae]|nr:hypothetical protein SNEBB_001644 [Seison nebaliae]